MADGFSGIFPHSKIITVGGGKGGVGKSIVSAGLACQLALKGKNVILVDADLSGANLHLSMGIKYPKVSLNDFLSGDIKDIDKLLLKTEYENIKLISGAGSLYSLTNPRFVQRQKLMAGFKNLNTDYLVIDVGAGADESNTDFYSLSENGIVVLVNEPTSIENAYSFLKNSIIRKILKLFILKDEESRIVKKYSSTKGGAFYTVLQIIEKLKEFNSSSANAARELLNKFRPQLIINMVRDKSDLSVEKSFKTIARKFLGIDIVYIGYIVYSDVVRKSLKEIKPLSYYSDSDPVKCLNAITKNLLSINNY